MLLKWYESKAQRYGFFMKQNALWHQKAPYLHFLNTDVVLSGGTGALATGSRVGALCVGICGCLR
jgi:hypothetical protein